MGVLVLVATRRRSFSKFRSVSTHVDGVRFQSKAEARRYSELQLLARAGLISDLQMQPRFPIVVNGVKVCEYVADFSYQQKGSRIIEDVKSPATKTKLYRLKKKLMSAVNGVNIIEVQMP